MLAPVHPPPRGIPGLSDAPEPAHDKERLKMRDEMRKGGRHRRRFPEEWGDPPEVQTDDYADLGYGFGKGSSTLKSWIAQKVAEFGEPPEEDPMVPHPYDPRAMLDIYSRPPVGDDLWDDSGEDWKDEDSPHPSRPDTGSGKPAAPTPGHPVPTSTGGAIGADPGFNVSGPWWQQAMQSPDWRKKRPRGPSMRLPQPIRPPIKHPTDE